MPHPHIIPSIFNYCDRWCERCSFIDRCTMGVIEQKRWAKADRWEPEDFFDELEKMWYQHLIFVKASRAISGMEDMDDDVWEGPYQNDANGSAKIAVLAAERSLGAWEMVLRHWPEKQPEILGFMRQINGFRHRMDQLFSDWRKFVRPGFDTEQLNLSFGKN